MSGSDPHFGQEHPSQWVQRFADLIPDDGAVLDLACGAGRHTRFFLARGNRVTAVDRDLAGLADLSPGPALERLEIDLEDGSPWPLQERRFDGVVVANYLYRPLFPHLAKAVAPRGLLLYETFALGNERFGRPRNPDFLLRPGELLDWLHAAASPGFKVLAYEDLVIERPRPAAVQRIAALAGAQARN